MTWKTGDTVSLPFYTETVAGVGTAYANAAAFTGAGWTMVFYRGSTALASQPTVAIAPISTTGWHTATFILPSGVDHILITAPANFRSDPSDILLIVPTADTDALQASIVAAVGGPATPTGVTAFDFSVVEGDNFPPQEFTIPLTALRVIDTAGNSIVQFADLSDITAVPWTIASSARGLWNENPANAVTFSFSAIITDKVNRKVAIGFFNTVPAAAVVVNPDGTADSTGIQAQTTFKYDIQLQPPAGSTYAGRKLTVVIGNFTVVRQQTTTP